MVKPKQFKLILNDEKTVYFPGNMISGQLVIELDNPMKMEAIAIKFIGQAYVHWTGQQSSGGPSAIENLFYHEDIVPGKYDNQTSLAKGHHVFSFQYKLPEPLPSSYEDLIGYIRYFVKATIVKPGKFEQNTVRAFTILDSLDLNAIPDAMKPCGGQESKQLCYLCCKSGPIEMEFHTDRSGYVPGEYILLNGTITNSRLEFSNTKVEGSSVQLIKRVTYHAMYNSKIVILEVARINGPPVPKHGSITWTNERLRIPPLPPSEINHCKIIDIVYFVQFQAHLRSFATDPRINCRITIGTIPLRNLPLYRNAGTSKIVTGPQTQHLATDIDSATDVLSTQQKSLQPPPLSYAESEDKHLFNINDEDGNEPSMGETSFKPQYTYYAWKESAFTHF
uniref:arrestin domain-containing protein 17-like isoform X2 n=1 Tax=Styela clava TaxID=7725 RepID=UPI00193A066E|nr:arrestin domain-containing protein 17-like isoform X2 [Styela clava]